MQIYGTGVHFYGICKTPIKLADGNFGSHAAIVLPYSSESAKITLNHQKYVQTLTGRTKSYKFPATILH